MREFCAAGNFPYVRDDDSKRSPFGELPIVVNYFFHEEIVPSAEKKHSVDNDCQDGVKEV